MATAKCHNFVLEGHRVTVMIVLVSFLTVIGLAVPCYSGFQLPLLFIIDSIYSLYLFYTLSTINSTK